MLASLNVGSSFFGSTITRLFASVVGLVSGLRFRDNGVVFCGCFVLAFKKRSFSFGSIAFVSNFRFGTEISIFFSRTGSLEGRLYFKICYLAEGDISWGFGGDFSSSPSPSSEKNSTNF